MTVTFEQRPERSEERVSREDTEETVFEREKVKALRWEHVCCD